MSRDWSRVGHRWPERSEAIARLVPAGASVIDIGAGAQGLRRHLDPSCRYTPADLYPRTPETLILDLNGGPWPRGRWDVAVLSGVLEYANDPAQVLRRLHALTPVAIVTYAHRWRPEWLTARAFAALAAAAGWETEAVETILVTRYRRPQVVWRLTSPGS